MVCTLTVHTWCGKRGTLKSVFLKILFECAALRLDPRGQLSLSASGLDRNVRRWHHAMNLKDPANGRAPTFGLKQQQQQQPPRTLYLLCPSLSPTTLLVTPFRSKRLEISSTLTGKTPQNLQLFTLSRPPLCISALRLPFISIMEGRKVPALGSVCGTSATFAFL